MTNKTKRAIDSKIANMEIYIRSIPMSLYLRENVKQYFHELKSLLSEQEGREVIEVADIRNKTTPFLTLIEAIQDDIPDLVEKILPQCKVSMNYLCKANLWPNTDEQGEGKEGAFEVVEYEKKNCECLTRCKNIKTERGLYNVNVASGFCLGSSGGNYDKCEHFRGHHVEGKSIRCSAKKVGG